MSRIKAAINVIILLPVLYMMTVPESSAQIITPDNRMISGRKILDRAYVANGLRTEARDYARFVIELMKESHVPKSTFNRMASPQINIDDRVISCLGVRCEQTPYGMKYFHSGNNGNRFQYHFAFYKETGTGFVFFMNCNRGVEFAERMNEFITRGK